MIKKAADMSNKYISTWHQASPLLLNCTATSWVPDNSGVPTSASNTAWTHLPKFQQAAVLSEVDVYLDKFISIVKGKPTELSQLMNHPFKRVDKMFRPNTDTNTHHKQPIYLKKLKQVDVAWTNQKVVLSLALDTYFQLLTLTPSQFHKVADVLSPIPSPLPLLTMLALPLAPTDGFHQHHLPCRHRGGGNSNATCHFRDNRAPRPPCCGGPQQTPSMV